ncbi:VG15 protein [Lentzea chajnantorensis]
MAVTARGRAATARQRTAQLSIRAMLLADLTDLWGLLDPQRVDETVGGWLGRSLDAVARYRRKSARSAADYYAELRRAEIGEAERPDVVELDEPTRARIATSLIVTGPTEVRSRLQAGEPAEQAAESALVAVQGAAGRHALDGGRQTLTAAGEQDQKVVAYSRVTSADACWFCRMLASRGFVYFTDHSDTNARFVGDGLAKFHDFCACSVEPSFVEDAALPAAAQAHAALWKKTTKGLGGERARLAFRRAVEGRSLPDDPINRT